MSAPTTVDRTGWVRDARQLGFAFSEGGLHRMGVSLTTEGSWATLRYPGSGNGADFLSSQLRRPGLWKHVKGEWIFDLAPEGALETTGTGEAAGGEKGKPLASLLEWALATTDDRRPRAGSPLRRRRSAPGVPAGSLLVRAGVHSTRGEVEWAPDHLRAAYRSVAEVPPDLDASRRAWAKALLLDAQARWRMVRLGWSADGSRVQAEVDLTGAPHGPIAPLLGLGLLGLRFVLEWILPPLLLVLDPCVESRLLETPPTAGKTRRKDRA